MFVPSRKDPFSVGFLVFNVQNDDSLPYCCAYTHLKKHTQPFVWRMMVESTTSSGRNFVLKTKPRKIKSKNKVQALQWILMLCISVGVLQIYFLRPMDIQLTDVETKMHESFIGETLSDISQFFENNKEKIKGEFTVVVQGSSQAESVSEELDKILGILMSDLSLKKAVEIANKVTKFSKSKIYDRALKIKNQ